MPAPSASIDFTRNFSLPFGVPPPLAAGDLAQFLSQLGAQVDMLYLDRPGRVEHDPGQPAQRLARQLTFANDASRALILPRTTKQYGIPFEPAAAAIDAIARQRVGAATAMPPASLAEVAARRFRWDATARAMAALPLPVFADESMIVDWPLSSAASGALGGALPGVLADAASTYLLATTPATRDGELDPALLRSPVVGLLRFERYRHIESAAGALSVARPSNAGAVVIEALPGRGVMPAHGAPIFRKSLVVFEHVSRTSAIQCVSALTWCQLTHRADIGAQPALKKTWSSTMTMLLAAWLSWLDVLSPGNGTDPLAAVPAAERQPFLRGFGVGAAAAAPTPSLAQIEALVTRALDDADARDSLQEFVRDVYSPLACGGSWKELGTELPVAPGGPRTPVQARAHRVLESLMNSTDALLPVYAGCPVGRPARFYNPDGTVPARRALAPLELLTTFDLEALLITEWTHLSFPGISAPALPDRFHAPTLDAFDGVGAGRLAAMRVVDIGGGGGALLLTRDWLDICTKGTRAIGRFDAEFDLSPFAAAGHPLAAALDWATHQKSVLARQRLDQLRTTTVRGRAVSVAQANLAWWVASTHVDNGGLWPVTMPGVAPADTPPTPSNPYGLGATSTKVLPAQLNEPSGFDEVDLAAALTACSQVRNGRTLVADLEPALALALFDREGLKSLGGFERTARARDFGAPAVIAGWTAQDFLDVAVANWLVFPFGLDLLTRGDVANGNGHPLHDRPPATLGSSFRNTFPGMAQRLLDSGILSAAAEPSPRPERVLAALRRRRLRVPPGLRVLTRSRSALALGAMLQMATFQWVHQRLSMATRPLGAPEPATEDHAWVRVDELVDTTKPPPPIGSDANSIERRRFLAYWGLVYLAFNTSPPTWNRWVNAAATARAAGVSVSEYLVFHRNVDPAAIEPAGPGFRTRGQRGNMLRFVVGLDAYLRMNLSRPAVDDLDPQARAWPAT